MVQTMKKLTSFLREAEPSLGGILFSDFQPTGVLDFILPRLFDRTFCQLSYLRDLFDVLIKRNIIWGQYDMSLTCLFRLSMANVLLVPGWQPLATWGRSVPSLLIHQTLITRMLYNHRNLLMISNVRGSNPLSFSCWHFFITRIVPVSTLLCAFATTHFSQQWVSSVTVVTMNWHINIPFQNCFPWIVTQIVFLSDTSRLPAWLSCLTRWNLM